MSKRGKKKSSLFLTWDRIIVYNDDKKSIKSFQLNEEQRLVIPIKSMKRKLKNTTSSSQNQNQKNEHNDLMNDNKNKKSHLDFSSHVIFSKPECKPENVVKSDIINDVIQLFQNYSCNYHSDDFDDGNNNFEF